MNNKLNINYMMISELFDIQTKVDTMLEILIPLKTKLDIIVESQLKREVKTESGQKSVITPIVLNPFRFDSHRFHVYHAMVTYKKDFPNQRFDTVSSELLRKYLPEKYQSFSKKQYNNTIYPTVSFMGKYLQANF